MHDFFAHFVWKMYKTVTKFNYEIFIHFVSWKGARVLGCLSVGRVQAFKVASFNHGITSLKMLFQ